MDGPVVKVTVGLPLNGEQLGQVIALRTIIDGFRLEGCEGDTLCFTGSLASRRTYAPEVQSIVDSELASARAIIEGLDAEIEGLRQDNDRLRATEKGE